MLAVVKNNWKRIMEEKMYLFVSLALTMCSIIAAIALTNSIETKGNIALVVSENVLSTDKADQFASSPYFNVSKLDAVPPRSELIQNRYDAIVTISEDGSFHVESIKSEELTGMIAGALENPDSFVPNTDNERKIGTNIIGYMMMFLFMQGVLYARLFAEDKEKHMLERVVMSPIAFGQYLLGHAIFMCLLIFTPSFAVIALAKIFGVIIGFSLLTFAGLITILAVLSTAFALMLNSFFRIADTANMLGSSLIVLSSILAGSFYSFSKEATLFDKLLHILPQKDFMDYVNALEKGTLTNSLEWHFFYVGILTIVFFVIAIMKTRKDYIYHK